MKPNTLCLLAAAVAALGCNAERRPASAVPAASSAAAPTSEPHSAVAAPPADVAPIGSPAFPTIADAVRQWHKAVREEGEAAHLRVTFDETGNFGRPEWEELKQRYDVLLQAAELEVLETLQRGAQAAVVVRGGPRVDVICLCQDAAGWHLSRRLSDFLSVGLNWRRPGTTGRLKAMTELAGAAAAKAEELAQPAGPGGQATTAFAQPAEALRAWVQAYQADGLEGHARTTVDQANTPEGKWSEILAKEYARLPPSGELEVLEIMVREPLGAALVRLDGKVARVCLLRDASGWRVTRTVKDWPLASTGDYEQARQLRKLVGSFETDITIQQLQWTERLTKDPKQ